MGLTWEILRNAANSVGYKFVSRDDLPIVHDINARRLEVGENPKVWSLELYRKEKRSQSLSLRTFGESSSRIFIDRDQPPEMIEQYSFTIGSLMVTLSEEDRFSSLNLNQLSNPVLRRQIELIAKNNGGLSTTYQLSGWGGKEGRFFEEIMPQRDHKWNGLDRRKITEAITHVSQGYVDIGKLIDYQAEKGLVDAGIMNEEEMEKLIELG